MLRDVNSSSRVVPGSLTRESGLTLIELLVATGIMLVTLTAVLLSIEVVTKQQPRVSHHGLRVQEARGVIERITKELRQSYAVNDSSSTAVDALTYLRVAGHPAQQRRVVFNCGGGSCTRQEGPVSGSLDPAQTLISGVSNTDIFTYLPTNVNPRYLRIKLIFDVKQSQADLAEPVTLLDGVRLRNVSNPS